MDIPNLAILTALAVFLLALHVAGAIIVLRTLRTAAHHMARLEELVGLENGLLEHEREKAIASEEVKADEKLATKPEAVKAQIVERKVDKVLSLSCLNLQNYLLDESKTVGQVLTEKGNRVISFIRFQVGEGIAKDPLKEN